MARNKKRTYIWVGIAIVAIIILVVVFMNDSPSPDLEKKTQTQQYVIYGNVDEVLDTYASLNIPYTTSSYVGKYDSKILIMTIDTSQSSVSSKISTNNSARQDFILASLEFMFADLYRNDPTSNNYAVRYIINDSHPLACKMYKDDRNYIILQSYTSTNINVENVLSEKIDYQNFYQNLNTGSGMGCGDIDSYKIYVGDE